MFATNQNPFSSAYFQSDLLGKGIFWSLFFLSLVSWTFIAHKLWLTFHIQRLSSEFEKAFSEKDPLGLQSVRKSQKIPHPFFEIYKAMKQSALEILIMQGVTALSLHDLELIEEKLYQAVDQEAEILEKNLFVLSTVVTLAPFLGLLGTVWGILLTFAALQNGSQAVSQNASMLSGLSLALATTVVGLIVAIPALVGHNLLKNLAFSHRKKMARFAERLLHALQMKYKKIDHEKVPTLPLS